jgi:hypothetical protein
VSGKDLYPKMSAGIPKGPDQRQAVSITSESANRVPSTACLEPQASASSAHLKDVATKNRSENAEQE